MNADQQYLNVYFQVHQPRRLKKFQFFDVGMGKSWFDDELNREIVRRIAKACYLPANRLLLSLMERHPALRFTFSLSGVAMEQFEQYAPEVLQSFRQLADTGAVEFLGETYYHSLSYFIDRDEFIEQVRMHKQKVRELFDVTPTIFRNTELIYSDAIGSLVADLGFTGMYVDGVRSMLGDRSPNKLYKHPETNLVLFPRNFQLSDDIAFRYADRNWSEFPLSGETFAKWLSKLPAQEQMVTLAVDYETFGEHNKKDSGIFEFLEEFVVNTVRESRFQFINPTEAVGLIATAGHISTSCAVSWADEARDLSAWLGNDMQKDAFESLYRFRDLIATNGNDRMIDAYRHLQTSDHFYYMATKPGNDGTVHQYFSPFRSPYEAFMNFMNVVTDLEYQLNGRMDYALKGARGNLAPALIDRDD